MQAEFENQARKQRFVGLIYLSRHRQPFYMVGRGPTRTSLLGHMTLRGLRRNAWTCAANSQTWKSSNFSTSPHRMWMISNSKMKFWKQLEICQKIVHKSSWNDCSHLASAGPTCNGLYTILHELSPNKIMFVANGQVNFWHPFCHCLQIITFWQLCIRNADKVSSMTPISRLIWSGGLQINVRRNVVQLGKLHICSNKLDLQGSNQLCHTSARKHNSSKLTLVWDWKNFLRSNCGTWLLIRQSSEWREMNEQNQK